MAKKQFTIHTLSPRRVLAFLASIIVFFLLLASVVNLTQKYISVKRRIGELQTQQTTLKTKAATLGTVNAYLNTPEGKEQALRDKYNLVKPGEEVIVITPNPTPPEAPPRSRIWRFWDGILHGLAIRKD